MTLSPGVRERYVGDANVIELKEVGEVFPAGELRQSTELHPDEPRWVKRLLRVGIIIVVIGVVAEWRCGTKLEDAHNAIHQYDLEKIAAADEKAGDAAKSAKTAHEEGDAAKSAAREAQSTAHDARQQTLATAADLKAEHDQRMELEDAIAPREGCATWK
jgi:hypothetical protein